MDAVRDEDLTWIRDGSAGFGTTLGTALPAGFAVYGVLDLEDTETQDLALLTALAEEDDRPLISGVLIRYSPRQTEPGHPYELYAEWPYRFRRLSVADVRARISRGSDPDPWLFPEILFPENRRWLVSTLWDDSWRSIGCDEATAERLSAALPEFDLVGRDVDLRSTGREAS